MKQIISSTLNDVILGVMIQLEDKYKDKDEYRVIMIGLKSASRGLVEITLKEIEDFKINNE